MFWPCETRTSTCRNLATISSGLYRFLAITVLLDVRDIPQVGPLQWGWITSKVEIKDENGALLATVDMKDSAAAIRAIVTCVREHPPKSSEPEKILSGTGFFVAQNRVL